MHLRVDAEPDSGNTLLAEDERDDLIPTHITTQADLNEWEQANILEAVQWAFAHRRSDYLSMAFLFELHRKMFDQTWKWAGKARTTAKNIGVDPAEIRPKLLDLLRDAESWVTHQTHAVDEIAARFHHRLVQIHPFPNGNGRHARLSADVLLVSLGRPRFSWGSDDLSAKGVARDAYISALRDADRGNIKPLLAFVRT